MGVDCITGTVMAACRETGGPNDVRAAAPAFP